MDILDRAIYDAERFLEHANELKESNGSLLIFSEKKHRGQVKASSMLLSRSLTTLRQTSPDEWISDDE